MTLKWQKRFLEIAQTISTYSTCARVNVGAVLVKDNRIISMGYNGVPSGQDHCIDIAKKLILDALDESGKFGYTYPNGNKELTFKMFDEYIHITFTSDHMLKIETPKDYVDTVAELALSLVVSKEGFKKWHGEWSKTHELHAESNAILAAAQNGISTRGTELCVTVSPCIDCAKQILSAGIRKVYYTHKYDRDTSGIEYLKEAGVTVEQVE